MTHAGRSLYLAVLIICVAVARQARAEEFPFGFEMTLDSRALPGSKRIPSLEIDDSGQATLELWCKGGRGQFSVAGDTVIFVPGVMDQRNCTPDRAQLDDTLVMALSEVTTWKRQGDLMSFIGTKVLRFHLNTN